MHQINKPRSPPHMREEHCYGKDAIEGKVWRATWCQKMKDVPLQFFKTAHAFVEERGVQVLNAFNESEYEGEWLHIGKFLSSMKADASWSKNEAQRILKKAYKYLLQGEYNSNVNPYQPSADVYHAARRRELFSPTW